MKSFLLILLTLLLTPWTSWGDVCSEAVPLSETYVLNLQNCRIVHAALSPVRSEVEAFKESVRLRTALISKDPSHCQGDALCMAAVHYQNDRHCPKHEKQTYEYCVAFKDADQFQCETHHNKLTYGVCFGADTGNFQEWLKHPWGEARSPHQNIPTVLEPYKVKPLIDQALTPSNKDSSCVTPSQQLDPDQALTAVLKKYNPSAERCGAAIRSSGKVIPEEAGSEAFDVACFLAGFKPLAWIDPLYELKKKEPVLAHAVEKQIQEKKADHWVLPANGAMTLLISQKNKHQDGLIFAKMWLRQVLAFFNKNSEAHENYYLIGQLLGYDQKDIETFYWTDPNDDQKSAERFLKENRVLSLETLQSQVDDLKSQIKQHFKIPEISF